jgi:hypothetical protein
MQLRETRYTSVRNVAKVVTPFELANVVGHRNMKQTLQYYTESAEDIAEKLA